VNLLVLVLGWLAPVVESATARVSALPAEPVTIGERGELSLVVLEPPERGLPLEIRIASTALVLDDNRLDWTAVVDPLAIQPRIRASFRAPSDPGEHEVVASVDYSICGEQWCRRKHAEVRWTVRVTQ
jgi:hypothetical protein